MPLRRDDGVLWATRVLGGFIVPFLLAAFALYLVPSRTGWFAWDIKPTMTTMLLGAGYAAGAYFFTRVVFADRWHEIHLGFLPITAFTLFMAIATARNLDRFDHGRVAFWVWTVLYVLTPILVPMTWRRNRRTDPRTLRKGDVAIPNSVRSALVVAGAAMSVVAVVLLVSPSTMVDVWPWTVTPLTAAVLGGWFALPGAVALMMAIDGRWSAARITLESQLIGLGLILVAVVRAWDEFDTSEPAAYLFAAGMAALFVGLAVFYFAMLTRQRVSTRGRRVAAGMARETT